MPQDKPSQKESSRKPWKFPWKLGGLLMLLAVNLAWIGLGKWEKTVSASEDSIQALKNVSAKEVTEEPADRYVYRDSDHTYELPKATVHVVSASPADSVSIAIADELMTVEAFAQEIPGAIAVINGGFFDPNNGKTTSHLISQGQVAGDPEENEGLTGNPRLQAFLPQIFNRSEFRVYNCPLADRSSPYDITFHDAPVPEGCKIESAIGAGPQLLPADTSEAEAFTAYENDELVRDAIGSVHPNARSALALYPDGGLSLIMVAQRLDAPGLTLAELTEFASTLGASQLLNLDGGSSSSLYYNGQTHLARLDAEGNPIQRSVKSVIVIE